MKYRRAGKSLVTFISFLLLIINALLNTNSGEISVEHRKYKPVRQTVKYHLKQIVFPQAQRNKKLKYFNLDRQT